MRSARNNGEKYILAIEADRIMEDLSLGDSIAVNGVCLTVTSFNDAGVFEAEVMPETFRRTNLSGLSPGKHVNLERALAAGGRFGGHFVSGHVDGTGILIGKRPEGNALILRFSIPAELGRHIIKKGSVAVNGVSLTVSDVLPDGFEVSLVSHTQKATTLNDIQTGERVNIEVDMIGKYVENYLEKYFGDRSSPKRELDAAYLQEKGFF